jgi:hypothetical protein
MRNDPASLAEYQERFNKNKTVEGFGIGNVYTHCPCPFCAAPDWLVFEVFDVEEAMAKSTRCNKCGRSAQSIIKRSAGGVQFELVQSGGPDQPDWMTPKMRRLEEITDK